MAWSQLGDVFVRQQRWDEAIAALQKSIWVNPYYSAPYILLGPRLHEEGPARRRPRACCGGPSSTTPTTSRPTTSSASCCSRLGRADEARRELELAERLQGAAGPVSRCWRGALLASALLAARPGPATGPCASSTSPRRPASRGPRSTAASTASASSSRRTAPASRSSTTTTTAGSTRSCSRARGSRRARGGSARGRAGEAPTNRLYRNNHDGTFADVTDAAGLRRTGWASSVCAGDYDNDGWLDLFVTYYGQNVLYRNREGRFEDVTRGRRARDPRDALGLGLHLPRLRPRRPARPLRGELPRPGPRGDARAGTGRELPLEGHPGELRSQGLPTDTNLLYHNEGGGRFHDVSEASGIANVKGRYAMTATSFDADGDGWTDVYVACDSTAAILFRNNHDGTFTDVAVASGVAFSEFGNEQAGMGLGVGDFDGDGQLDLFKTHFADDIPALYRDLGRGLFEDVAMAVGPRRRRTATSSGARGRPTSTTTAGRTSSTPPATSTRRSRRCCRSTRTAARRSCSATSATAASRTSRARSGPGATAPHSSRGVAFGDYDNDGDLDVLVMNMNEPPSLLRNDYDGRQRLARAAARGHALEPGRHRRDRGRDRGRAPPGAGGAQPVQLLLARRPAPALRPRRRAAPPSASRCAGRAGRSTSCATCPG